MHLCSSCNVGVHEAHPRCLRPRERYPRQLLHRQSVQSVLHACSRSKAIKTAPEQQQHHKFTRCPTVPCSMSAGTNRLQTCMMTKRDCQFGRCCEAWGVPPCDRCLFFTPICVPCGCLSCNRLITTSFIVCDRLLFRFALPGHGCCMRGRSAACVL
jgi:hypothetical protein